jgi:two-component system, NarL family, sensor kinase
VASEILAGADPERVGPRMVDTWGLVLDWGAVRDHAIPRSRLPRDVTWVGRPDYFWEAFPRTAGTLAGLFLLLIGTGVNLHLRAETTRRARDARSQLSRRLMTVLDRDRSRVARDLHDDLCQELTVIALQLDRNQPPAADRVRGLIDRTRAIAHGLHAAPLDRMPFQDAVIALARNVSGGQGGVAGAASASALQSEGLTVTVDCQNWPEHLPDLVALNLYRSVQESLQNVMRHAKAQSCRIQLDGLGDTVRIRIIDDGVGFQANRSDEGGLGLLGIRERMMSLGGTFRVKSRPGRGTEIELMAPLAPPSVTGARDAAGSGWQP